MHVDPQEPRLRLKIPPVLRAPLHTVASRIKMPQVIPHDGTFDPKAFVMSFGAGIQSVGGDITTMAKSLVMAITVIARTWYTTLEPGRMFS